jgi:hypothetical protein
MMAYSSILEANWELLSRLVEMGQSCRGRATCASWSTDLVLPNWPAKDGDINEKWSKNVTEVNRRLEATDDHPLRWASVVSR